MREIRVRYRGVKSIVGALFRVRARDGNIFYQARSLYIQRSAKEWRQTWKIRRFWRPRTGGYGAKTTTRCWDEAQSQGQATKMRREDKNEVRGRAAKIRKKCEDELRGRGGTRVRADPDPPRREKVAHVDIEIVDAMEPHMGGDPVEHMSEAHIDTLSVCRRGRRLGRGWYQIQCVGKYIASADASNYRRG